MICPTDEPVSSHQGQPDSGENAGRLLSILIPTLESRRALFSRLQDQLQQQISQTASGQLVEVLPLSDDGEAAVGAKRNQLMEMASGSFVVFVDDDDRVSDNYIFIILKAIRENPLADCISFAGEISFCGRHARKMIHSIAYTDWQEQAGAYLRPPCHITPIRRDIALRYRFAEIDYSEDMDWALRICRDRALQREALIDQVLYYYDSRRHYAWQWALDRTQTARHALGLRFVNRLALNQRLSTLFKASGS